MGQAKQTGNFINGRLLLAMPGMGDPRFDKAVIYVCAHDENGAMGLVINKVLPGLDMVQMFEQLDIDINDAATNDFSNIPVLSGGPVEQSRGFVLHTSDFNREDTIKVDSKFAVTGTVEALKDIAGGQGPDDLLFILGYAGWSAGQLDAELQDNAWLILEADHDVLFETKADNKWTAAINKMGIDPLMLSDSAGRA